MIVEARTFLQTFNSGCAVESVHDRKRWLAGGRQESPLAAGAGGYRPRRPRSTWKPWGLACAGLCGLRPFDGGSGALDDRRGRRAAGRCRRPGVTRAWPPGTCQSRAAARGPAPVPSPAVSGLERGAQQRRGTATRAVPRRADTDARPGVASANPARRRRRRSTTVFASRQSSARRIRYRPRLPR